MHGRGRIKDFDVWKYPTFFEHGLPDSSNSIESGPLAPEGPESIFFKFVDFDPAGRAKKKREQGSTWIALTDF